MKKVIRQLLLFSSAVVFLALAPLVIFYAMGYRYGITSGDTLPVGVMLVESFPRRASVIVNDQNVGTTPHSIPNLSPGEVSLAVGIDGYRRWEKKISVTPAAVTELRNIRLFPAQPVSQTMLNSVTSFSLSPNRQLLAILSPHQLRLIDEDGLAVRPPISLPASIDHVLWSPDNNYLLLISQQSVSLINLGSSSVLPAVMPKISQAADLAWDPRVPGRLLVLTSTGNLQAHQLSTGFTTQLAAGISSFATSSRHIYAVIDDQINVLNLQGQLLKTLSPSPKTSIDQLHVTPAGQIAIQFSDRSLAVYDDEKTLLPVADYAKKVGWSPDGQLLYVQTDDSSLHVYNAFDERLPHLPLNQLQLVIRLSRAIRHPQWFAGGHHLIYQTDDEITVTEIDTRDHPISYTVDSTNLGDSQATVGQHGEVLYYLKRQGERTQLISTSLIVE